MNIEALSKIHQEKIMGGLFGIEWEALRIRSDGKLALTPHPSIFGDKLNNPLVTTDFSESQIEIITPPYNTTDQAIDTLLLLTDIVNTSLSEDEFLLFQSLPCILPENDEIPIAKYAENGRKSYQYRKKLAQKYGLKKQMISGVHFNYSLREDFIEELYQQDSKGLSYKEYKDEVYLKIARNYLRYSWLIIYLTGSSVAAHKTFTQDCLDLMDGYDNDNSYYSTIGVSLRNASCGYKNLKKLYPSYENINEYVNSIQTYIEEGDLSEAKELYTQIRLKPENPDDLLTSLQEDGIQYVEIRTLDTNPYIQSNNLRDDMNFLHIFLIYLLVKEESQYPDWQKESKINEELVAERVFDDSTRLLKDSNRITFKEWANEILTEIHQMCQELNLDKQYTVKLMQERIDNPNKTYAKKLLRHAKTDGFVTSYVSIAKEIKNKSVEKMHNIVLDDETKKIISTTLMGRRI